MKKYELPSSSLTGAELGHYVNQTLQRSGWHAENPVVIGGEAGASGNLPTPEETITMLRGMAAKEQMDEIKQPIPRDGITVYRNPSVK